MVSQDDPQWHRVLPWAKLAHNYSVHRALSMNGEGPSPAEVHLGRKLRLNVEAMLNESEDVRSKEDCREVCGAGKATSAGVGRVGEAKQEAIPDQNEAGEEQG